MTDDSLARLTAQAMGYAWGQQDAGIGTHVDAMAFAHHFRALRAQPNCPAVHDAWTAFIRVDPAYACAYACGFECATEAEMSAHYDTPCTIECEHCGRTIPFAESSENMCAGECQ